MMFKIMGRRFGNGPTEPNLVPLDEMAGTTGTTDTDCLHYWIIEPAAGPTSLGVCRKCGEEGAFKNYVEGNSFGNPGSSGRWRTL